TTASSTTGQNERSASPTVGRGGGGSKNPGGGPAGSGVGRAWGIARSIGAREASNGFLALIWPVGPRHLALDERSHERSPRPGGRPFARGLPAGTRACSNATAMRRTLRAAPGAAGRALAG